MHRVSRTADFIICYAVLLSFSCHSHAADKWPEWRGPTGQGHSDATNLPVKWSETENVTWKTKIPGLGWSTPVIENGRVWVTTAIDRLASEKDAAIRRKTSTNAMPLRVSDFVSLRAICVDFQTGKIIKDVEVMSEKYPQMIYIHNSYATPTPIIEDGKLYCYYGTLGMACLDTSTYEVLWTNRDLRVKHENGPGSSPVMWNDLLIFHCDGIDFQYIAALDKNSGKLVWKTDRSGKLEEDPQKRKSYATPLVVNFAEHDQVISPAADWVYSYDPQTGRELWKLNYGQLGFSNSARPVVSDDLIYICTGFPKSKLIAIGVEETDGNLKPVEKWRFDRQVPNVASLLRIGNQLYFASDRGVATCIDATTGETLWVKRIGQKFWAAPLFADGKIYFFDTNGTTTVIKPGRTYQHLATNKLPKEMLATAAAIDGALILRNSEALYRISE